MPKSSSSGLPSKRETRQCPDAGGGNPPIGKRKVTMSPLASKAEVTVGEHTLFRGRWLIGKGTLLSYKDLAPLQVRMQLVQCIALGCLVLHVPPI